MKKKIKGIICFPDTFESQRFLSFLSKYNLPCILVGKEKWLKLPNYENIIDKILLDNISLENVIEIYKKILDITKKKI